LIGACGKLSHFNDMKRLNFNVKGCRSKTFPPDRLFLLVHSL